MAERYWEVVLNRPFANSFTYKYPDDRDLLFYRVLVNFHNRSEIALVVRASSSTEFTYKVKEILQVLDEQALISQNEFLLAQWISNFSFSTLGESLFLFVSFPQDISKNPRKKIRNPPPPHVIN